MTMADEEIDRIFSNAVESCVADEKPNVTLPPPLEQVIEHQHEEQLDWEYRLPAPPTFRDHAHSPTVTEYDTLTIGNLTDVLGPEHTPHSVTCEEPKLEIPIQDDSAQSKSSHFEVDCCKRNIDNIYEENLAQNEDNFIDNDKKTVVYKEFLKETSPYEREVVKELTSTLQRKSNRTDNAFVETSPVLASSTLENFKITTYKDTKPVEVFEDDSIKSSVGEKRDKSKDDAVFRAPKARVKEPNLSRTSSFSLESKSGPMIKRSVSYVSLLAANMPRNSQPYRAHLRQPLSDPWPSTQLRKTTSEINIDNSIQYDAENKEESSWKLHDDSSGLQSVQVLRKILSRSHANLSTSIEEPESSPQSDLQKSKERFEEAFNLEDAKLERSRSDEDLSPSKSVSIKTEENFRSETDQENIKSIANNIARAPAINLSTWSERPKRQISIKNDCDYTFGANKRFSCQDDFPKGSQNDSYTNQHKLTTMNETLKAEARSKSIGDLSRIPIVRAVELKKPYAMHNINQTTLRPVEIVNDETSKVCEEKLNNSDENKFIGVNSLAKRFGVTSKRPTSVYAINHTTNNFEVNIQNGMKSKSTIDRTNLERDKRLGQTNELLEKFKEVQFKTNGYPSNHNPTSEIKALSKISSGGFVEDTRMSSPLKFVSQKSSDKAKTEANSTEAGSKFAHFNTNKSSTSNTVTPSIYQSTNSLERNVVPGLIMRQSVDRKPRPISLQPVVKGFKIPTEKPALSTFSLPKTKEIIPKKDLDSEYSQRTTRLRTLSTPNAMDLKESAKENNNLKLLSRTTSQPSGMVPPPPPMMPALKPVGERKAIKFLPPPEADPRDLLMNSIRAFRKDNLKTVSK